MPFPLYSSGLESHDILVLNVESVNERGVADDILFQFEVRRANLLNLNFASSPSSTKCTVTCPGQKLPSRDECHSLHREAHVSP